MSGKYGNYMDHLLLNPHYREVGHSSHKISQELESPKNNLNKNPGLEKIGKSGWRHKSVKSEPDKIKKGWTDKSTTFLQKVFLRMPTITKSLVSNFILR